VVTKVYFSTGMPKQGSVVMRNVPNATAWKGIACNGSSSTNSRRRSHCLNFASSTWHPSHSSKLDCVRAVACYHCGRGVDRREDLTHLSFPDGSFDLVYASHVLEHILDDQSAIREIRRVLSVGGVAVLPVPIISNSTVEYGKPIGPTTGIQTRIRTTWNG
jgi:SAM-dependent methyltransferase